MHAPTDPLHLGALAPTAPGKSAPMQKWLRPAIPPVLISDQYAPKLTASTTAALVHSTQYANKMPERNNFVRCLMVDFTKAFDAVDHAALMTKLSLLVIIFRRQLLTGYFLLIRVKSM